MHEETLHSFLALARVRLPRVHLDRAAQFHIMGR